MPKSEEQDPETFQSRQDEESAQLNKQERSTPILDKEHSESFKLNEQSETNSATESNSDSLNLQLSPDEDELMDDVGSIKQVEISSLFDMKETTTSVCTFQSYTTFMEDTLQWAREMFEDLFTRTPLTASQYIEEAGFLDRVLAITGAQSVRCIETVTLMLV